MRFCWNGLIHKYSFDLHKSGELLKDIRLKNPKKEVCIKNAGKYSVTVSWKDYLVYIVNLLKILIAYC